MCHEAWTRGHQSLKEKMQECQPPIPVSRTQYPLQVHSLQRLFFLSFLSVLFLARSGFFSHSFSFNVVSQPEASKGKRKRQ
jgi:hypothetical protein